MTQTSHWAETYIGQAWEAGAHDCWAFFRAVQREQFGRAVPVVDVDAMDLRAVARAFDEHPERAHWQPVDVPAEGDAVLLAHARYPSHVGVWVDVDGGGVLHCQRGDGVVFSRLSSLRISGWGRISYYRAVAA